MHLVHLTLISRTRRTHHEDFREMIESVSEDGDGLEHVSVHRRADADPILGLFLRSQQLRDAEHTAEQLWGRATRTYAELAEYQLFKCQAPPTDDFWP